MDMPISLSASVFEYTGETHDKNVIYMAATLYVPRGKKAMYQMTEGWKNFLNVVETDTKFKLKYYVDGQEYKTYEIQATEVVTPDSRRHVTQQHGLNIVRMSDGTTKKVLVK